ncbi:MFS transporter [Streptomyces sp. RKAG290]|uniref:MFS transporter n=1 Tax=Streptomyces sp. RKAG290 TaxID=2888348 RepID=UPI0020340978|nr:MFS transporter [Streptomyces sp. RKAG290]MCM2416178.1 MFS transporter [Streptomyces sp. RKAG290]
MRITATAELAGRSWSGRAMGIQNTGQNLAASLTPPLLGGLITAAGYAWGFLLAAAVGALAVRVVPVPARTQDQTSAVTEGPALSGRR